MILSIIIPVYNVETAISDTLESVLSQTTDKYEVIVVDDGSSDASGKICDQYAQKYSNLKVLHTDNQGVSVARNLGLNKTEGEWITFVDGDDTVSNDYVSTILNAIKNTPKADLFILGQCLYNKNGINRITQPNIEYQDPFVFYHSKDYNHSGCAYCFKKNWINNYNISFPVGAVVAEDQAFIIKYLSHHPYIVSIPKVLYSYLFRAGSVTRDNYTLKKANSNLIVLDNLLNYCDNQTNANKQFLYHPICDFLISYVYAYNRLSEAERRDMQRDYRKSFVSIYKTYKLVIKQRFLLSAFISIPVTLYLLRKRQLRSFNIFSAMFFSLYFLFY